jgi:hypothetical protein
MSLLRERKRDGCRYTDPGAAAVMVVAEGLRGWWWLRRDEGKTATVAPDPTDVHNELLFLLPVCLDLVQPAGLQRSRCFLYLATELQTNRGLTWQTVCH